MKTNYRLIILEQGNIIVSNEEIKEGDLYFLDTTGMKIASPTGVYKQSEKDVTLKLNNLSCNIHKIIASDSPDLTYLRGRFGLPSIDYNGLEEKFDIVDVRKIANDRFIKLKSNGSDTDIAEIASEEYTLGFKEAQSLNDKKFSLEDMEQVRLWCSGDYHKECIFLNDLINKLQQPKVFDIEIEMEVWNQKLSVTSLSTLRPKITNNSIKITKVL